MQYFYHPHIDTLQKINLPAEEASHAIKVLRHKEGDEIHVLNGSGKLFTARIVLCTKKECWIQLTELLREEKEKNQKIHIAISPIKNSTRMEWFYEKAVELNVHEITPIICQRTEKCFFKRERFEKIMISAMKQSGNLFLPQLHNPCRFEDFVQSNSLGNAYNKYLANCEATDERYLSNLHRKRNGSSILLVGPEGDFTESEIELATKHGFENISLGKMRLRTETAGIVALVLLSQNDFAL